jgi:hypothetical protein
METTLTTAHTNQTSNTAELNLAALTTDGLEQLLIESERSISQLRNIQARIVSEIDRRDITRADGARTLDEWVSGRIDIDPGTAATLRRVGNNRELQGLLEEGITFDRVTVLAQTGLSDPLLHLDLAGARRVAAHHHRITRRDEAEVTAGRYLLIQPNLEDTSWRLHGLLPSVAGAVVAQALDARADQIALETGSTESRAARRVDALVSLCASNQPGDGEGLPVTVTVVVEAKTAAPTHGEAGGWIVSGPRVGPATLEQLLCETVIEVTALTQDGQPLAIGTATTTIPPRLRRFILARDTGCVIEGCTSTNRLQPHHITPRHQGGNNHPNNLATLCWHHHHTVIHGHDYRIDPDSPPGRRRLLPPDRDPPG